MKVIKVISPTFHSARRLLADGIAEIKRKKIEDHFLLIYLRSK